MHDEKGKWYDSSGWHVGADPETLALIENKWQRNPWPADAPQWVMQGRADHSQGDELREIRRGQRKAEGGTAEMRKSRCLCGRPLEYQELHPILDPACPWFPHYFLVLQKRSSACLPTEEKTTVGDWVVTWTRFWHTWCLYRGSHTKAIMSRDKTGCTLWFSDPLRVLMDCIPPAKFSS